MSALDKLHELYDELPDVACKGLCWNSCGPIDMSDVERQRITELGVDIPAFTQERSRAWANDAKGDLYCPALSFKARDGAMGCTVYRDRPLICRVWGVGEDDLACPHGCETTGRLSHGDVTALLMKSFHIGGHDGDMDGAEAILVELMDDPSYRDLIKRWMSGDASALPHIQAAIDSKRRS